MPPHPRRIFELTDIARILIGDNPFNLVDHFSQERSRLKAPLSVEATAEVVLSALHNGATGFNFSSTKKIRDVLSLMRETGSPDFGLYPIFPDVYGLARAASERGFANTAKELLGGGSIFRKTKTLLEAGTAFLTADPRKLLRTYLSAELACLERVSPTGARLRAVILHEVLSELIVSFRLDDLLREYVDYVRDEFRAMPGFVTRNFVRFLSFVEEGDFGELIVMTPFNKVGYQMNPSREECERALVRSAGIDVIAMSVLSAGFLTPNEAFTYLKSLPQDVSCVVGVSTVEHAIETFSLLSRTFGSET